MHRLYCGFGLSMLAFAVVLTGCGQPASNAPALAQVGDPPILPGESKPAPKGESKPAPKSNPDDPKEEPDPLLSVPADIPTDPDTLPVLPKLTEPTGDEKYEAAVAKAFLLMTEKKDREALESLKEALAAKESDFVKGEIERLQAKIDRTEAAQKTVDDIQAVLANGRAMEASRLATEALLQYGDHDLASELTKLKRQADAFLAADLAEKEKRQRFVDEAEEARKSGNLRSAVLAYEQAVAAGADLGDSKATYDDLRVRVAKYDDARVRAGELRRNPDTIDDAVEVLKVGAQAWDTPQIRQEIAETELALNNRRERIAVADFEVINDIGIPRAGHAVSEELKGHFRPKFDLVESTNINGLLEELKLDPRDLQTNDAGRAEFGKLVKARYVVVGSISRLGGIHVNARVVDLQTGLVMQTARIVAADVKEMTNRLPALARMLQMDDEQKRDFENRLAQEARPVQPPVQPQEVPPPPAEPQPQVAPAPAPAPIIVHSPRAPEFGQVVIDDFNGFPVVAVGGPAPAVIVVNDAPLLFRDRAFFVALELGDNLFRRGHFRDALRHYEFALAIHPGHLGVRLRIDRCLPFCPPVVIVPPVFRPRLVVLPFAEFRLPFRFPSTIPPGLGLWTSDAIAPYFAGAYDVVDRYELFWWMGRLGMTMRDVICNPYARLVLGRALGARYFLMGALHEIASFDVSTHIVDSELNVQTQGTRVRVQNAHELRHRLPQIAQWTVLPQAQQAVVVQQQVVVQRQIQQARIEFGNGKVRVAIGIFKEVLVAQPNNVEVRQALIVAEQRNRQAELEAARIAAFEQQQGLMLRRRDQQIALAAAAEAARLQAQQDAAARQQIIDRQNLLAHQNLLAQAALADRQNNLEQRVALLESAVALRRDDATVQQLAASKARLGEDRRRRLAAETAAKETEQQRIRDLEVKRLKDRLAAEEAKRLEAEATLLASRNAEYTRFLDQGRTAMARQNFNAAVSAFQNAKRLKPSAEIETLIAGALVEQARVDALKKGAEEKRQLEAQLAAAEARRKAAEAENAKLKARYDQAMARARAAMKDRKFDEAVTSFKLASAAIRTDEAADGLRTAEDAVVKAKTEADVEAKQRAEALRIQTEIDRRLTEGKTALSAKQFPKAVTAFKAAVALRPGDVELQKQLTLAEQALTDAQAETKRLREEADRKDKFARLMTAGRANLASKQLDAAIVAFSDALKLAPSDSDAKTLLAQARAAQAQMVKDATAQAEAKKRRDEYEGLMQRGRTAVTLKQFADALGFFQKAQTLLPGDAASAEAIKDVQKRKLDQEAGVALAKRTAEINQLIATARAAIKAERFVDAKSAADRAVKLDADNLDVKRLLVDIDTAEKAVKAAVARKEMDAKRSAKVTKLLADARTAIGQKNLQEAAKHLAEAAVEDPRDPGIVVVQREFEVVRQAMLSADAEAKKKQTAYDTAVKNARLAIAAKRYADASIQAAEALKLFPGDPAATQLMAQARKFADDENQAAMEAQKRRTAYESAMRDASAAMTAKKYAEAVTAIQNALTAKPGDLPATQLLAQARKLADAENASAMEAKKRQLAYDSAMKDLATAVNAKKWLDVVRAAEAALLAKPGDATATQYLTQARKLADAENTSAMEAKKRQEAYDLAMKEAGSAMTAKKYADAIRALQAALVAKPADVSATQMLAQARKLADAENTSAMDAKKRQEAYDAAIKEVIAAANAKKYADALKAAQAALVAKPGDPTATQYVAQLRKLVDAENTSAMEAKKRQEAYDAAIKEVIAAANAKKYADALKAAQAALVAKPGDPTATQYVAQLRKLVDAENASAMEAKKRQEAYEAAMKDAVTALNGKKYADAVKAAQAALVAKPSDATATQILTQARKLADAESTAAMEAMKKKQAFDAAMAVGRQALQARNLPAAEKAFTDALRLIPNDPTALAFLKQTQAAAAEMAANQRAYEAHLARGRGAMTTRNFAVAIEAFTAALKLIPGDPTATKLLAEARTAAEMPKVDPVPKVDPKPKIDPKPKDDPAAKAAELMRNGGGLEKAGKYAEAAQAYADVLKWVPAHPTARTRLNFCVYMDQGKKALAGGKLAEAAANFDAALRLDPGDQDAKKLLKEAREKKKG